MRRFLAPWQLVPNDGLTRSNALVARNFGALNGHLESAEERLVAYYQCEA